MKEYYHNKRAADDYFRIDERGELWGCTGDIGYMDDDGLLFVLGRSSDSFVGCDGNTVYLFDIEEEIMKDEAVKECKVVQAYVNNSLALVAHIVFDDQWNQDENLVYSRLHKDLEVKMRQDMIPKYFKKHESMPINKNGKRDVDLLKNDVTGLVEYKYRRADGFNMYP